MNKLSNKKSVFFILYMLIVCTVAIYTYKKPHYNWDMLAYMAAILSTDQVDCNQAHTTVYSEIAKDVPHDAYVLLVDTSHRFKKIVTYNPSAFCQNLPFVFVKPLYVFAGYVCHKCGVSLVKSTLLPSTISYLLITILLYCWLMRYISPTLNFFISGTLAISGFLINAAKLSTPDCMSALFILGALFFIIEKRKVTPAFILLMLAMFTRIDNVIFCFLMATYFKLTTDTTLRIDLKQYLIFITAIAAGYLSIAALASMYGSNLFLNPVVISTQKTILENATDTFSIKEYILARHSAIMVSILFHQLFIYAFIALAFFIGEKRIRLSTLNTEQSIAIVIFLTVCARIIVNPDLDDRFHVAFYLIFSILLVRRLSLLINQRYIH